MLWNILEKKEKTGNLHRKVSKYAKILYSLFSAERAENKKTLFFLKPFLLSASQRQREKDLPLRSLRL
jgi:hypothetical protein